MARNLSKKVEGIELAILGPRRAIGEEDALFGGFHKTSAQCHSQTAEVLVIDKEEFRRILQYQHN